MTKNIASIAAHKRAVHHLERITRLPYKTAEEIEASLAALWVLRRELDFRTELVDNAIAHLQKARAVGKKQIRE